MDFELQFEFYDYIEAIEFKGSDDLIMVNNTLTEKEPNNELGDNVVFLGEEAGGNSTFSVHGRVEGRAGLKVKKITCIEYCDNGLVEDEEE